MIDIPWDDLLKLDNEGVTAWFQEARRCRQKAVLTAAYDLYDAHGSSDEAEQEERLLTLLLTCEESDKVGDWLSGQQQEFFERRKENRKKAAVVRRETLREERQKREEAWTRGLTPAQVKAIRKAHRHGEEISLIPIRETRDERIRNDQLRSPGFISLRGGTPARRDRVERMVE